METVQQILKEYQQDHYKELKAHATYQYFKEDSLLVINKLWRYYRTGVIVIIGQAMMHLVHAF